MDGNFLTELAVKSTKLALMMSLPLLTAGMVVGFIIAIFQATTSIQEQTLSFIPKIIAIFAALIIFGPWIGGNLIDFTKELFNLIPDMAMHIP